MTQLPVCALKISGQYGLHRTQKRCVQSNLKVTKLGTIDQGGRMWVNIVSGVVRIEIELNWISRSEGSSLSSVPSNPSSDHNVKRCQRVVDRYFKLLRVKQKREMEELKKWTDVVNSRRGLSFFTPDVTHGLVVVYWHSTTNALYYIICKAMIEHHCQHVESNMSNHICLRVRIGALGCYSPMSRGKQCFRTIA